MRSYIVIPLILAIAAAVGLGSAYFAVRGDPILGAVRVGPWEAWPRLGAEDADPYSRAVLARSGVLPFGLGEGVLLLARTDQSGAPLDSACVYRLAGSVPRGTRAWTVTVYDGAGALEPNPTGRNGFTSAELLREADGSAVITLARVATSGNWLPLPSSRNFTVALRLYDGSLSPTAGPLHRLTIPSLTRVSCP